MSRIEKQQLYFIYDADNEHGLQQVITLDTIPQSVSRSKSANWASQSMLGRLSPAYVYTGNTAEVYTFTVDVHEDMITHTHKDLPAFVEDIKKLSYGIRKPNGLLVYPKIYFQLGEISGIAVVDTTLQWNKPITNGHYVLININFTITIVEPYIKPVYTEIETVQDERTGEIGDIIYSGLADEEYRQRIKDLKDKGYLDNTYSDFIKGGQDKQSRDYLRDQAIKKLDYATERLTYLYGVFVTSNSGKMDSLNKWTTKPEVRTYKGKVQIKIQGKYFSIETTKIAVSAYLDNYWKTNTNNVTLEEIDKMKRELFSIIDSIEQAQGEVIKYAASK